METEGLVSVLKENGSVLIKDSNGALIRWTMLPQVGKHNGDGVFLIHELYQLRGLCKPFSEISLDIVEWSEDSIIFHSEKGALLSDTAFSGRMVKFALIKETYWKNILKRVGEAVLFTNAKDNQGHIEASKPFPLCGRKVKEMYLSAEGRVKMLNK